MKIPGFALALLLASGVCPAKPPQGGTVETRFLDSRVLTDNRIGLDTHRSLKIYLPPGYAAGKQRYPVIYWLHSINWSNEKIFAPEAAAKPTFDRAIENGVIAPFIVVAPDYTTPNLGAFYANSTTAGRWEDYTIDEVIPYVDANFRTLARAESRAITGDLIGAYGAMRYAFDRPDIFSVVYGMHPVGAGSGETPLYQRPDWNLLLHAKNLEELKADQYSPVFALIFQTFLPNPQKPPLYCDFAFELVDGKPQLMPENVQRLKQAFFLENIAARQSANLRKLRGIKFDWGRYDPTFAHVFSNRILSRDLDELGIEHEAEEYRGLPWDKYWIDNGRVYTDVLPFFGRLLQF